MRPAVAVGVFPGAVFAVATPWSPERSWGWKVGQAVQKMTHKTSPVQCVKRAVRVLDFRTLAQVEPPVQNQAQTVKAAKPYNGSCGVPALIWSPITMGAMKAP